MNQQTKNLRAKMTNKMMERVYSRSNDGQSVEEIMMNIAQDGKAPLELRFKAAAKVADLVFPKAAAVEMEVENNITMTGKEMDAKLHSMLSKLGGN